MPAPLHFTFQFNARPLILIPLESTLQKGGAFTVQIPKVSLILQHFSYQCKEWDCHAHTLLWEKCRKSIEICLVYLSSYPITFCNSAACFFRGNEWSRMNYFLLLLITLDFTGVLSLKVYLRLGKTGRSDPFGLKLCTRTFPRPRLL